MLHISECVLGSNLAVSRTSIGKMIDGFGEPFMFLY
jgi:hypothetical protein